MLPHNGDLVTTDSFVGCDKLAVDVCSINNIAVKQVDCADPRTAQRVRAMPPDASDTKNRHPAAFQFFKFLLPNQQSCPFELIMHFNDLPIKIRLDYGPQRFYPIPACHAIIFNVVFQLFR